MVCFYWNAVAALFWSGHRLCKDREKVIPIESFPGMGLRKNLILFPN